ncbi:uncharacterized protein LOC129770400 [Toxorhynchites rutilus septentrionalis]|uniref:uncharacterized protein LOC129770400 n=1 Tax=Toxorhynchites rutilus septentrionalis TaxID=329112 RepID=UPI00247A440F|nr:uncharacterized protein LOC129770400 [Toxorhynchites rutilus septentrionalis]
MADRKSKSAALYFPEELSMSDTSCVVCFGDAKNPVFCTTCRKMFCCDCMVKCQQTNGCANCRSKTPPEVFVSQSGKYRCEKHELLITMLCTECDICVCKQCLGREAEHSLHSFLAIDDIRAELCREVEKIYEYQTMVDSLQGLKSMSGLANQFAEKCLINIESFNIILCSIENTIGTFIKDVNTYELKELIKHRKPIKEQVQNTLEKISTLQRQEPQQIYDFGEALFGIEKTEIATGCVKTADDKFGNRWRLETRRTFRGIAFYFKLLHGTPGRYEVKINSSDNSHQLQKVLEFKSISHKAQFCELSLTSEDICFTISLRPTNFKYYLQCAKVYSELVENESAYSENIVVITKKIFHAEKCESFIRDGTGTMWRTRCNIHCHSGTSYLSVCLVHYDGAVGRFEFFVQLVNQKDGTKPIKVVRTRRFHFGSEYCIKKFVALNNLNEHTYDLRGGLQLVIGIRPTANNQSFLRKCFDLLS